MKKEYKLNADGICILSVLAFTQPGEFSKKQESLIVSAMIDVSSPSTHISRSLADRLEVKVKNELNGKKVEPYTFIGINIKEIWDNGALGLHPFIYDGGIYLNNYGCDVVLGCDFLTNVNFERRGKDGIFSLATV